jgi:predicted nucleic acid-binding Zn ribbon protein
MPQFIPEHCYLCGEVINDKLSFLQNINPFFNPPFKCENCQEAMEKMERITDDNTRKLWLEKRKKLIGR